MQVPLKQEVPYREVGNPLSFRHGEDVKSRYSWLIQIVLLCIANKIKALILSKSGGQLLWILLLAHRLADIH